MGGGLCDFMQSAIFLKKVPLPYCLQQNNYYFCNTI